jgi:hypothetical protein
MSWFIFTIFWIVILQSSSPSASLVLTFCNMFAQQVWLMADTVFCDALWMLRCLQYVSNLLSESQVRVSGVLSSPFEVLSGVPQASVLGPLLFNVFINDICDVTAHSKYLLFTDDVKIYHAVKSPEDCDLLQSGINSV